MSSDNGDHGSATSSTSSSRRRARSGGGGGSLSLPACVNWCTVLAVLAALVSLGMTSSYFNRQVRRIKSELEREQAEIARLDGVVDHQAEIIKRFNASVTNKDVLHQVAKLESRLEDTEAKLNARMDKQYEEVEQKLQATLDELNEAVTSAEAEIHSEVDIVKSNVESYVRTTQDQFSMENSFMIYQVAGTFTLIGSLISMWHMTAHLRKFNVPFVQRKILAILWMCPIYSVTSWLSLVFGPMEGYLRILKDCYEAYVIYMFLAFLIAVLGRGNREAVVDLVAMHADHLQPPVRLCGWCCPKTYDSPRAMADAVLLQCQLFAMQFVLFKPLTSIAMFVLDSTECCDQYSTFDYRSPRLYVLIVENVSIFLAFYGLLKFYHAVQEDLVWCRPWPKFLCIKGVVFMTFWQGLAISILASSPWAFKSDDNLDEADRTKWADKAQDFLICLEMLIFAIAHFYVFPTEEWQDGYRRKENKDAKFGDNLALRDFLADLKLVLGSSSGKRSSRNGSGKTLTASNDSLSVEDKDGCDGGKYGSVNGRSSLLSNAKDDETDFSTPSRERDVENVDDDSVGSLDIEDLRQSFAASLMSPELQEATARLLRSTVLQNLRGDGELERADSAVEPSENNDGVNVPLGDEGEPRETTSLLAGFNSTMAESPVDRNEPPLRNNYSPTPSSTNGPEEISSETGVVVVPSVEGEETNETERLLGECTSSESPNVEEILRPSIFTTLGEMGKKGV